MMEHAFVCCEEETVQLEHLPLDLQWYCRDHREWRRTGTESLEVLEREAICRALEKCGWHLTEASRQLGISRSTLWRKLKLFGIHQER